MKLRGCRGLRGLKYAKGASYPFMAAYCNNFTKQLSVCLLVFCICAAFFSYYNLFMGKVLSSPFTAKNFWLLFMLCDQAGNWIKLCLNKAKYTYRIVGPISNNSRLISYHITRFMFVCFFRLYLCACFCTGPNVAF